MIEIMQTVRIVPLPELPKVMRSRIQAGQEEAARVWTLCRDIHAQARKAGSKWPGRDDLQQATKGQFALHSQSVQMICHAFLANIDTTHQLRQSSRKQIRYPWRDKHFYPVLWPAQAMALSGDRIVLPMGRGRASIVLPRPDWLTTPAACKIVWNGLSPELHVTVATRVAASRPGEVRATVDLGQIHLAAVATSSGESLVVSGRGIRAAKRQCAKQLGEIARKCSRCKKGSRRWKKLQRARAKVSLCAKRCVRDLRHKGTRQAINFCILHHVGSLYIGNPDGVRNRSSGRHHNQRMSQWEYGKDMDYLRHKAKQARIESFTGTERGTSSRCPVCGHRHKPNGRQWRCKQCGFEGHRDVVGAVNMHPIAFGEKIAFPHRITYLRPGTKVPARSSRPDTGQRCLTELLVSSTGLARAPQGAAQHSGILSEAHPR